MSKTPLVGGGAERPFLCHVCLSVIKKVSTWCLFLFVKERRIWPSRKLSKSLTQPSKLPTWTPWRNVTNVESMCSSGGLGRNPIPENNKNKQWYHCKKWQSNFKCIRKFTSVTWKNKCRSRFDLTAAIAAVAGSCSRK